MIKPDIHKEAADLIRSLELDKRKVISNVLKDLRKQLREAKDKLKIEESLSNSYIKRLHEAENQRDAALAVLTEILNLYPYLNCVCGRTKSRINDNLRESARKLLKNHSVSK
jgi:hypothetical protein